MSPWHEKAQRALDELKYHNETERQMLAHVINYDGEPYHTVKGFIERCLAREEGWKPPGFEVQEPETILDCLPLRWEIEIVNRTLDEWTDYDGWRGGALRAISTIGGFCRDQPPGIVAMLWTVHLQHPRFERENRRKDDYLNTLYNEGCRMVGQLVEAHDLMGIEWPWPKPPPAGEFRRRAGEFLEGMGLLENGGWC